MSPLLRKKDSRLALRDACEVEWGKAPPAVGWGVSRHNEKR